MSYHVFLSYPRIADERGAVSDIRAHLAREIMIKTGEPSVVVFQDRSGLKGGDPWSEVLEEELRLADVFVPFLCPLWLTSEWCAKELTLYLEFGRQRGVDKPIVPLLWEKTEPRVAKTRQQIEILALVTKHQVVPWETLRHRDSSYPGYREALGVFADAVAEKLLSE
jgi:TIR domain-containing protein